ncbi:MAG: glutamine-synthetase adenylyltransferase, partial [Nitrospirae bacterium]
ELTRLAEVLLAAAVRFACDRLGERYGPLGGAGPGGGFAVVALGKLGAGELNYSSDVDLLYLYGQEGESGGGREGRVSNHRWAVRAAQGVTRLLERATPEGRLYRVDLRLRPDGAGGPLALTPEACGGYYEARGQGWERMALLRARPVAGDPEVGRAFLEAVAPFVYRRTADPALVASVRELKRRHTRELAARRERGFHVKLGTGGIREVEFFCQTLQLLHAGREPRLRCRNTFQLLHRLRRAGLIDAELHASQLADYRLLRRIEQRLQMEEDRQTHLLPEAPEPRRRLALGLGYPDLAAFDAEVAALRDRVHLLFLSLFAREEDEAARRRRRWLADHLTERLAFVDRETAEAVLAAWPAEALEVQEPAAIADGLALLAAAAAGEPAAVHLVAAGHGRLELRLAAADAVGLAALSTGALAAAGLDIVEG